MRQKAIESNDARLPGAIEKLRAGESLLSLSASLGFNHNGPLRTALRELLGVEQYAALLEENVAKRYESARKPKRERQRKKECSPVQALASEGAQSQ
jgi:hypothetical protein